MSAIGDMLETDDLLSAWVESEKKKFAPLEEGEVTQDTWAKKIGAKRDTAATRLKELVDAGLWTRREAIINGKSGWAYRPKEKPKK